MQPEGDSSKIISHPLHKEAFTLDITGWVWVMNAFVMLNCGGKLPDATIISTLQVFIHMFTNINIRKQLPFICICNTICSSVLVDSSQSCQALVNSVSETWNSGKERGKSPPWHVKCIVSTSNSLLQPGGLVSKSSLLKASALLGSSGSWVLKTGSEMELSLDNNNPYGSSLRIIRIFFY